MGTEYGENKYKTLRVFSSICQAFARAAHICNCTGTHEKVLFTRKWCFTLKDCLFFSNVAVDDIRWRRYWLVLHLNGGGWLRMYTKKLELPGMLSHRSPSNTNVRNIEKALEKRCCRFQNIERNTSTNLSKMTYRDDCCDWGHLSLFLSLQMFIWVCWIT